MSGDYFFHDLVDFQIGVLPPDRSAEMWLLMQAGRIANEEFLGRHPRLPASVPPVTGSFIYAHPPNYRGRPTMRYTASDWGVLFDDLIACGVDTVIHQAAVTVPLQETFYPTSLFPGFRQADTMGAMLEAAADRNMQVYLGGVCHFFMWEAAGTLDKARRQAEVDLRVLEELRGRYGRSFHGWYVASEICFPGERSDQFEDAFAAYFGDITRGVKDTASDLQTLVSPWTHHQPDKVDHVLDYWASIYRDSRIDVVAPQDSIGAFANQLRYLDDSLTQWKQIANMIGADFWVNAESFECVDVGTVQDYVPADFARFAQQLIAADRIASKTISWELPYFFSDHAGSRGRRLREQYLRHCCADYQVSEPHAVAAGS